MAVQKTSYISLNHPIGRSLILSLILPKPKPPDTKHFHPPSPHSSPHYKKQTPHLFVIVFGYHHTTKRNTMAASLQAAATLMQPTKVGVAAPARGGVLLRSSQSVSKAFGVDSTSGGRISCSLQNEIKDMSQKFVDATKIAGFALATSALVVSVCFTFSLSYPFCFTGVTDFHIYHYNWV